jgi:hypothetical protein
VEGRRRRFSLDWKDEMRGRMCVAVRPLEFNSKTFETGEAAGWKTLALAVGSIRPAHP